MRILYIDIKSENQTCLMARAQLLNEIDACKLGGFKVLKVIHGYGSHGVGGEIKKTIHQELTNLKKQHKITDFMPCEKWSENSVNKNKYYDYSDELRVDFDLHIHNAGITIILI